MDRPLQGLRLLPDKPEERVRSAVGTVTWQLVPTMLTVLVESGQLVVAREELSPEDKPGIMRRPRHLDLLGQPEDLQRRRQGLQHGVNRARYCPAVTDAVFPAACEG